MEFGNTHLIYRITTGKIISKEEYYIQKINNGITIQSGDTLWQCDDTLAQTFWKYKAQDSGDSYSARREKIRIYLEGIFERNRIKKVYTIDHSPWSQCAQFFLTLFAGSDRTETLYWFISPHNLQAYKIKALKIKTESMVINNKSEDVQKIRIRATGFEGNFWYGDYWFREKDSFYLRYEAVHGPPGTPPTVKEFTDEKKLILKMG